MSTGFPLAVMDLIVDRSGGLCEVGVACDLWTNANYLMSGPPHHRRARGMGGTSDPDGLANSAANGLAACVPCHSWIEANPDGARVAGWMVPFGVDPTIVPVLYRGSGRVWFRPDGTKEDYVPDEPGADEFDAAWSEYRDKGNAA